MSHRSPKSMRHRCGVPVGLCGALLIASAAIGETQMIEDFSGTPASRWELITDQVMGGVSTGRVAIESDSGQTVLHL